MVIYRLNRIPDKLHVALMDLLGIALEPATAARADLRFRLAAPPTEPVFIPASSTEVCTPRAPGDEPVVFQTLDDVTIPAIRPTDYVVAARQRRQGRRGGRRRGEAEGPRPAPVRDAADGGRRPLPGLRVDRSSAC